MKHALNKSCLGVALLFALSTPQASSGSELLLADVINRAGRIGEASLADPVRVFELDVSLPKVCTPSAVQNKIQGLAALALRQHAELAAVRTYFTIQDQENRLLAAGERVADSYVSWQRMLSQTNTLSASVVAQAETGYFDALAHREEIRLQLRQSHFLLASQIGAPEAQAVELQPLEDIATWLTETSLVPPQGLRAKALVVLRQWWQQDSTSALGRRCRQHVDSTLARENRESGFWFDIGKLRLQTLVKYELPAAEAGLRFAEMNLDQARANVPGAPKLGVAMTNSLLALNRLQTTRHAIYLERLQLERGVRAADLTSGFGR